MGDTTNTAARITATAPPGTIHAHPLVVHHSRTRFVVSPAGPFAMKGKTEPLAVDVVGEESGTRESQQATRLPLLGRDLATNRRGRTRRRRRCAADRRRDRHGEVTPGCRRS